jgi:hypothetical protein
MASSFKNIFAVIIIMMMCVACLPEPLELTDVPAPNPKIVVSSQGMPGYPVAVLLTRSISALDGNEDSEPIELLTKVMITDATVRIEGGGISYQLQYVEFGVYGNQSMTLVPGESYTLFVDSPTMGSVTSTTIAEPLVPFQEVDASIYISGRDTLATIRYQFKDEAGSNWYMLNAQQVTRREGEMDILNPTVTTKVMSDEEFEGTVKAGTFKMLFDEVVPGDTIAVTISNIGKDYYDFMKLREDTRFGFAAVLGEPINYPTNVKGGLGFFTLYSSDRRVFTLKEYGNL